MFGPSTAVNPLTKITALLAAAFLILSLAISWQSRSINQEVFLQEQSEEIVEEGILPDSTPKK
jgi:preprotein translocase subunit SecG